MRAAGKGEEKERERERERGRERKRENTRGSVSLTNPSIETAWMKCLLVLGKEAQWSGATSKRMLKQLAALSVSLAVTLCFPRALSYRDESAELFRFRSSVSRVPAGIPKARSSATIPERFRTSNTGIMHRVLFGYSFVSAVPSKLRGKRV